MDKIPVIWHEGVLGLEKRSRYADATLLNEAFDYSGLSLLHCSTMKDCPPDAEEAVVVIHGEHELRSVAQVCEDVERFKRSVVIVFCDDGAHFPTRVLVKPNRKIWQQMPIPGRHDFTTHRMICGYPHDTQMYSANYSATLVDRPLDWFFAGQITHVRRVACVTELRKMPNGILLETPGFWQGLGRAEYFDTMAKAKIVPCPSGPVTPDTIRMAEAFEFGCLPLIDATCSLPGYPDGYWQYVLGCTPPVPIVRDWSTLPEVMAKALAEWPENRDVAMAWWDSYKKSMHSWLRDDFESLRKT